MTVEACFVTSEPSGLAHDGEVFGDGGEVTADLLVDFADAGGFGGEDLGDTEAGGVGEGLDNGDPVDSFCGGLIHYLAKVPNTLQMSKRKIPQSGDGGILKFLKLVGLRKPCAPF